MAWSVAAKSRFALPQSLMEKRAKKIDSERDRELWNTPLFFLNILFSFFLV